MNNRAKEKSREYFNEHRKSKLAHGGYWRHDYRYALAESAGFRNVQYKKTLPFSFQCVARKTSRADIFGGETI